MWPFLDRFTGTSLSGSPRAITENSTAPRKRGRVRNNERKYSGGKAYAQAPESAYEESAS